MHLKMIMVSLLLATWLPVNLLRAEPGLQDLSLSQLEQRVQEIETDLLHLAQTSLRSGVGAVGYRSETHKSPHHSEWIHIDLEDTFLLDQIVLVPTIGRDFKTGLQADGFPLAFRIVAGTSTSTNEVASFSSEDHLLPRIAPLIIPVDPQQASWIRLECSLLSPRIWADKLHTLQLSEILVFSGMMNVALQKPVTVSSAFRADAARHERFLVDGFGPYLMDAAHGEKSFAAAGYVEDEHTQPWLTIDLERSYSVSQVNLHATDLSHNIPEAAPDDHAVPRRFRVTGASHPDFSDEVLLFEYVRNSIYDAGPIIMRGFPATRCRYVRMTALEIQPNALLLNKKRQMGFAEIEVLSHGENVALGKPVDSSPELKKRSSVFSRITDGSNFYGEILPSRVWMNQLALRHDLETERPQIVAERNLRYAHQKTKLQRMIWMAMFLAAGIAFTVLIDRMRHMRHIAEVRERFAADLHDELGANIHTIGLLSDAASSAHDSMDEWKMFHQRIRNLTERTGTAIRHFANIVNADGLYFGLVEDFQRACNNILAQFEHSLEIDGEEFLNQLKPRRRVDLVLFYKEALMNICRHSDATSAKTRLSATPREIILTINDNGKGLPGEHSPSSLKRRARLLKGKLCVTQLPEGGTSITLRLRNGNGFRHGKARV